MSQDQSMDYGDGQQVTTEEGFDLLGEESRRLSGYWKDQLDHVKDEYKKWEKRGRTIEKRYRDERARMDAAGEEGGKRYASLWANVQTLLPALYGRQPVPIAERKFKDKDPVGRGAASILERALRNEVEINGYDEAVGQSVLDYLLPGRGICWVRYEPEIGESISLPVENEMDFRDAQGDIEPEDDSPVEDKLRQTSARVVRESAPVDYVSWSDFFTFPAKARTWKEVTAVGKRVYPTRDMLKRRFGSDMGKRVPLEPDDRERRRQRESVVPEDEANMTAEVYEIWSRADQTVYWMAEGYDFLLDKRPDPLELEYFFPVPRPLYANPTNNTLVPVADYMQYQDQAMQIDELVNRISTLTKACKVAGVYNAAAKDIQRLLDETVENELIPVDSWGAFAEKGGIAGQIALLPLKEIIGVINELNTQLDKTMAQMDRLTGITDIMRGTGDARETMGGQRLKSNNGGTRTARRQAEVARYCRDIIRIVADVMCRHFSPRSLIEASGALYEEGLGPLGGQDPDADSQLPPANGIPPAIPQPLPQAVPGGAPPPPVGAPPLQLGQSGPGPGLQGAGPGLMPGPLSAPPMQAPMAGPMPGGPPPMGPPGNNVVPFPGGQPPQPGMLGAMAPPQQPPPTPEMMRQLQALQRIAASIKLLRNERLRGFRVDIEVDSTIFGDAQQEKADRVEFISSVTKFLQTAAELGQQVPAMAPLLGKLLQFGVRGFRVGRDLEASIDEFCDEAEKMAKQQASQPKPPNPEEIKAQAEQTKSQVEMMKAHATGQQLQTQGQLEMMKAQATGQQLQTKMQGDQIKSAAEVQRQQLENQGEAFNSQADLASKQADVEMRKMEMEIEKIKLQIELAKVKAAKVEADAPKEMPGAA